MNVFAGRAVHMRRILAMASMMAMGIGSVMAVAAVLPAMAEPSADGLRWGSMTIASRNSTPTIMSDDTWLATGEQTITVRPSADMEDVGSVALYAPSRDGVRCPAPDDPGACDVVPISPDGEGAFAWTVHDGQTYRLDRMVIVTVDGNGHVLSSESLADIPLDGSSQDRLPTPTTLIVDDASAETTVSLDTAVIAGDGDNIVRRMPTVMLTGSSPFFEERMALLRREDHRSIAILTVDGKPGSDGSASDGSASHGFPAGAFSDCTNPRGSAGAAAYCLSGDAITADFVGDGDGDGDESTAPGTFVISLASPYLPMADFPHDGVPLSIDSTPPALSSSRGPAVGEAGSLAADIRVGSELHDVLVSSSAMAFDFRVEDPMPVPFGGRSTGGDTVASGVASISVSIPVPTDLAGTPIPDATRTTLTIDPARRSADGSVSFELDGEGFYDLRAITIVVADKAGNSRSMPLIEDIGAWEYDAVVIDRGTTRSVDLAVRKAGTYADPTGHDGVPHYRGDVEATYTVTDRWFPLYQKLHGGVSLTRGSVVDADPWDGSASTRDVRSITPAELASHGHGEEYVYSVTVPVRPEGDARATEGRYVVALSYGGFGTTGRDAVASARKEFVMDWTAPSTGGLSSSVMDSMQWGWAFSTEPVIITLDGVRDAVSGVDAASAEFASLDFDSPPADRAHHPLPSISYSGSVSGGSLSFGFDRDGQRLSLNGTSIRVCDVAGNCAQTGSLRDYGRGGDMGSLIGIVVDSGPPALDVSYDNTDARNGTYYKAHRTATITVDEVNFDLLQRNAPHRIVAEGETEGARRTVPVSAFRNPSGDGRTYVAQLPLDVDGDWSVDVALADPAGRAAAPRHDEFTIDTVAPILSVSFDRTSAVNGRYYDTSRTATVTVAERNFSPSESVISTTRKDDEGVAAQAPSPSRWTVRNGASDHRRSASVVFSRDGTYALTVRAADLAGNVATVVREPEFVIDTTAPAITIVGVSDNTAYAGSVIPGISYDDANIDRSSVSCTLSGARRGDMDDVELDAMTTRSDRPDGVAMAFRDFDRTPSTDDVYTLSATVRDLAGNVITASRTFSVNRFGSTYSFVGDTGNLRGAYLRKPSDVTIAETNVSGLRQGTTRIVVSHGDRAIALENDQYAIDTGSDEGWSRTVYTIPAARFSRDGYYRVLLQSVDNAGNLSQNTMDGKDSTRTESAELSFAIDGTSPSARLLGVRSGGVYRSALGRDVGIDVKDNMAVNVAELYVDGRLVRRWTGEETLYRTPRYLIPSDGEFHTMTVRTVDDAGNEARTEYDHVYVGSSWDVYAMRAPSAANAIIVGVVATCVVIAGISVAAIVSRRSARRGSYRGRDPESAGPEDS